MISIPRAAPLNAFRDLKPFANTDVTFFEHSNRYGAVRPINFVKGHWQKHLTDCPDFDRKIFKLLITKKSNCERTLGKEEITALFAAIMLLIAMPTYFAYISNSRQYAEEQNITGFAEETADIIVGEVNGEIVAVIFGLLVSVVFVAIGLLKGLGLI